MHAGDIIIKRYSFISYYKNYACEIYLVKKLMISLNANAFFKKNRLYEKIFKKINIK